MSCEYSTSNDAASSSLSLDVVDPKTIFYMYVRTYVCVNIYLVLVLIVLQYVTNVTTICIVIHTLVVQYYSFVFAVDK